MKKKQQQTHASSALTEIVTTENTHSFESFVAWAAGDYMSQDFQEETKVEDIDDDFIISNKRICYERDIWLN
jgi:hypothetical protein